LGSTQQYYPITHSIFWIEQLMWGDTPLFYHLVNILLHVAAALLLLKTLRTLEVPDAWLGDIEQAITTYQEVLAIQPDHVAAHTKLGNLFLQQGNAKGAIEQYDKAMAINPQETTARINLAWILATAPDPSLRNGARALELARQTNERSRNRDVFVLRSLAGVYAETGQFVKALQTAEEALRLATENGNRPLIKALSREIESYRAGTPYRQR
jgi:tetratricopeptide (TPR) repeat protein